MPVSPAEARRPQVQASRTKRVWAARHQLAGLADLHVEDGAIVVVRRERPLDRALDLARCDAVVTDVAAGRMSDQAVHDTYVSLQRVERDFRQMKTGLLEVRPIFVRKDSRTRGHVFGCMLALKISRDLDRARDGHGDGDGGGECDCRAGSRPRRRGDDGEQHDASRRRDARGEEPWCSSRSAAAFVQQ